jgi:hypothetical protein
LRYFLFILIFLTACGTTPAPVSSTIPLPASKENKLFNLGKNTKRNIDYYIYNSAITYCSQVFLRQVG